MIAATIYAFISLFFFVCSIYTAFLNEHTRRRHALPYLHDKAYYVFLWLVFFMFSGISLALGHFSYHLFTKLL